MTSFGYAGTIGAGEWVIAQRILGCRYAVLEPSHFQLGANTSGITLSAGAAGGGGVYDEWDTTQSVTLTKPASGMAWWMICIRRNWTTLGSTLVAIPAGTSMSTPTALPARNTTMGGIDDQPLWLVAWPAASSTPVLASAVDLRLIGRGPSNYVANHDRVREYFKEAGATLRIGGMDWICAIGVGGVLNWVQSGVGGESGSVADGDYYKLPDGTLFCWQTRIFPPVTTGDKVRSYVWPYPSPAPFITAPMPFVTPLTEAPYVVSCSASSVGTTSMQVNVRRETAVDTRVNFAVMGRWK